MRDITFDDLANYLRHGREIEFAYNGRQYSITNHSGFWYLCVDTDHILLDTLALLCWGALKTQNVPVLYVGNALSLASSYAVAKLSHLDPMGYYFKPFTAYSLMLTISVVAVIVQTVIVVYYARGKRSAV